MQPVERQFQRLLVYLLQAVAHCSIGYLLALLSRMARAIWCVQRDATKSIIPCVPWRVK